MARLLFVRIAGALGATSLAAFFVVLIPFLSAEPSAGAGFAVKAPSFTVNREFKSDRLSLPANINYSRNGTVPKEQARTPEEIPVGCDSAFSPISSPRLAHVFGRCMT